MEATKRYRIWAQGATDQVGHRNYLTQLLPHMKACTDFDFELDFKTNDALGDDGARVVGIPRFARGDTRRHCGRAGGL